MLHFPVLSSNDFTIYVNDKKSGEGYPFKSANKKVSYNSKSDDFIAFKFLSGTIEISAVDDFKL